MHGAKLEGRRPGEREHVLPSRLEEGTHPHARRPVERAPADPAEGLERRGRGGEDRSGEQPDRDLLAPFTPPPPALVAPPSISTPAAAPPPGTAAERAQLAALVDRLVTSMRVGRVGKDGHEVHLRLTSEIEVRLRHDRGTLEAELRAPAGSRDEADRIAAALTSEMEQRGVVLGAVRVC